MTRTHHRARVRALLIPAALASLMGLSACGSSSSDTDAMVASDTSAPVAPAPTSETTAPAVTAAPVAPTSPAAGVLAPGQSATGAAALPFVNFDKKEAVFSHRVVSVDPVAAGDRSMVLEKSPELTNYALYTVRVESSYVSGDDLAFSSFSDGFSLVDANRIEVQSVMLIGYDFCKSDSIPSPGNDPAAVIRTCVLAAAPSGAAAPAGIRWDQMDTPYDEYDGQPAFVFKG